MKLTDVVDRINGNVDRFNTDLLYYIGGEHFDSEELIISKRGTIKDNLGKLGFKFHFAFQDRDVIFMARNPHLRKAGMVRFSGLCSDASYILRSKDERVISQEFLAVMLQSDRFWDYCESHKVGSVNFANNWSTIANYEFELPDSKFQKELADKVWAAYEVKQSYLKMIDATDEMVKAQFVETYGDPITNPKGIPMKRIKDVCKIEGGSQPPRSQFIFEPKEGYVRFIQIRDYKSDDHITYIPQSSTKKFCNESDIMIGRYGPPIFQILCGIKGAYNVALMKAIPININKEFLRFYLKRDELRHHLERFQSRSAGQAGIDMEELYNYPCPYPSVKEQERWVSLLRQADKSKAELRKSIDAIDKVIKSLINENL